MPSHCSGLMPCTFHACMLTAGGVAGCHTANSLTAVHGQRNAGYHARSCSRRSIMAAGRTQSVKSPRPPPPPCRSAHAALPLPPRAARCHQWPGLHAALWHLQVRRAARSRQGSCGGRGGRSRSSTGGHSHAWAGRGARLSPMLGPSPSMLDRARFNLAGSWLVAAKLVAQHAAPSTHNYWWVLGLHVAVWA